MYKKILLPALLMFVVSVACLGSNASYFEDIASNNDTFPKIRHVVIGNWNNLMDPRGCVMLDQDNYLKIKSVFTFAVSDLTPFPAIHYTTEFFGGDIELHPAILNSDLSPSYLPNGDLVYIYEVEVFVDEFNQHCNTNPGQPISFDYNISLTDANGDPYPLLDHPELFTLYNSTNPVERTEQDVYPSSSYAGTKDLCCYGYDSSMGAEGFVEQTGNNVETAESGIGLPSNESGSELNQQASNSAKAQSFNSGIFNTSGVFPNPFNDQIKIKFQSSIAETSVIKLWDASGRVMHYTEYKAGNSGSQEIEINTSHFNAGLYFCNITSANQSETIKILKVE